MKKIIIILIIIVIIIGIGLGIFWLQKDKKPLSDFTVYSNADYGFSLEYPTNWYKVDNPEFSSVFFSSKEEEPPMGGVSLGARIEIFVMENSENLGLEEWIEESKAQEGPEEELMKKEEITVGGRKAIKEVIIPRQGPIEEGSPITVYLAKDDYIIQINYTGRDTGLETDYWGHLQEFQHLLDSFKFSEKSSLWQDGLSFETAIVIEADKSDEGIDKEYEWLYTYGCPDKGGVAEREMQELQEYGGHKFDLLYTLCNNGDKEIYYFQIDSFYGKW